MNQAQDKTRVIEQVLITTLSALFVGLVEWGIDELREYRARQRQKREEENE